MRFSAAIIVLLASTVAASIVPGRNDIESREIAADADFYRHSTPVKRASAAYPSNTAGGDSPNGNQCSTSAVCASGYCHRGSCDDKKPVGHVCYKNQGCSSGSCVNKVCVPSAGSGSNGSTCNMSSQCTSGSSCQWSKCASNKADGQFCYKDNMCTSSTCYKNRCVTEGSVKDGQSCKKSTSCSSNYCKHGKCSNKKPAGHRCYKNQGCTSGACSLSSTDNKLRCE